MVARHLGRHIPGNPQIVPKNMEGAGGLRLANWLYQAAPRDGTVIGATSRNIAFEPLIGNKAAQYDSNQFTWLGSANDEVSVCASWHTSGVATFNDVLARELTIGSSGTADDTYQYPRLINNVLGSKFKIITGYPGGNDVSVAMERGEVAGRCGWSWSSVMSTRAHWLTREKDQRADSAFALQASRPAAGAADHGPCAQRRGAADVPADLRAPGDGPAVPEHARRSAGIACRRCRRRSWTP